MAATVGFRQGVQFLSANGANIEATRNDTGFTPLDIQHIMDIRRGEAAIGGANIEATLSDTGVISLDTAAYHGQIDVVRLLKEKGANIEATRSNTGFRNI